MSMSTYTDFATKVEQWLNRENFTSLTGQVEDLTAMGQRRIHRECDLRAMETVDAAFTIDSQSENLPADFLRAKALTIVQGSNHHEVNGRSLKVVLGAGQNGRPQYYSTVGTDIYFGPVPDQGYTATFIYYAPLDIVSTSVSTNWILTNVPELLLFATLLEASLFLKDDQRAAVWAGRYDEIKQQLELSEERQDKEGGGLAVR